MKKLRFIAMSILAYPITVMAVITYPIFILMGYEVTFSMKKPSDDEVEQEL